MNTKRYRVIDAFLGCAAFLVALLTQPHGAAADGAAVTAPSKNLAKGFQAPPPEARPWVYWFWLDGNITREGITADLEAMKRMGIGGVLIMEVDQRTPKGPARFGSPTWRELFKHAVSEADRLGLQVNMNNDAGWCGSGGPWVTSD
ncbi:MAG TPA: glycosyl hydrolase [Gemmataceae bacterium]|nr:glycosyl hydrolase [Gemmataceae bacterium]